MGQALGCDQDEITDFKISQTQPQQMSQQTQAENWGYQTPPKGKRFIRKQQNSSPIQLCCNKQSNNEKEIQQDQNWEHYPNGVPQNEYEIIKPEDNFSMKNQIPYPIEQHHPQKEQSQQKNGLLHEKRISYLQSIVHQASQLVLRIISSVSLPSDLILNIDAQGLKGGFRNIQDGYIYFGTKKHNSNNKEIINDFIIPSIDLETNEKHLGRHFQIYFDTDTFVYNIQDFGVGLGVFLKLIKPIILKDNYLFSIGHVFISVTIENQSNQSCLLIKLYDMNGNTEQRKFWSNQNTQINIGRSKINDIYYDEDSLLSKTHCMIQYNYSSKQWFLVDNESTNGSWIYLQEPLVIENGMIFKSNQTIFQAIISA